MLSVRTLSGSSPVPAVDRQGGFYAGAPFLSCRVVASWAILLLSLAGYGYAGDGADPVPAPGEWVPLPDSGPLRRVVIRADQALSSVAAVRGSAVPVNGTVVYRNAASDQLYRPGMGRLIADDLVSTMIDACDLAAYTIQISGGGDGTGPGFDIEVGLYDECPHAGGRVFPRTFKRLSFPDNGSFEVVVDFSPRPTPVTTTVWLGVQFSTDQAGWLAGMPAELGFTADSFGHPFTGCSNFFGGFPSRPHGSFAAELIATTPCAGQHVGYRAARSPPFFRAEGAGVTVADDIDIAYAGCELASYEVRVRGISGPFRLLLELHADGPGEPIAGTRREFFGLGDGTWESARFLFEPGVFLPQRVYLAWTPDQPGTGVGLAARAQVGESGDYYALYDLPTAPGGWSFFNFGGNPRATFHVTIGCHGALGTGACCLATVPGEETCVDDVAEAACLGRWRARMSCVDAVFDPPCGATACCLPDDTCDDLLTSDCLTAGGVPQAAARCDQAGQVCPVFACWHAEGDCFAETLFSSCESDNDCPPGSSCQHNEFEAVCSSRRGCCRRDCCDAVCREDPFCCAVDWDFACVQRAHALCTPPECPSGEVWFLDPPVGVVDARQPHPPADGAHQQGIDRLIVAAPAGAERLECWNICSGDPVATPSVTAVEIRSGGTLALVLDRPFPPGAQTQVRYGGNDHCGETFGHFTFLPGDVNGDGRATVADILAHVDHCLNNQQAPAFGAYSCDIDRSGLSGGSDLLRLIDLLNGAGDYAPWQGRMASPVLCP